CMERDALRDAGVDAGKFAAVTLRLGDMLTTTSNTDQNGKLDVGAVQPGDDGDGIYHIRVSNKDNPNDTSEIYFDGTVAAGDSFTALASAAGRNEFGSETRVHIFDDDGTYLQTINFHTSCSAPIAIGDQYGSVSLVGGALLDKGTGGLIEYGVSSGPGDAGVTYAIVGGADAALFQVDPATGEVSFIDAPDYENPLDDGADNTYDVIVRYTKEDGSFEDTPLEVCIEDDCIKVVENTSAVIDLDCGTEGNPDLGLDLCMERDALRDAGVDAGKFAAVTLRLGDMLTTTSNTDQNGKLDVGAVQPGDDGDGIYHIRVSNKDNPNDTSEIYFDGTVAAGDSFTALASAAGRNEFGSETRVHIFDDDGTYLQTINFHTSCSAPIAIG
ncbi:cadherin repeat domain-containing protein, partial [Maliponia aquimaris]|uniref:cadherin repeat domain-containing protein n=1 Tax=Maliponia aquimaris TaxID=1673631 RepID=UPI001595AF4D